MEIPLTGALYMNSEITPSKRPGTGQNNRRRGFYKRCPGTDGAGNELSSFSDAGLSMVSDEIMRFLRFHEELHYRKIARLSAIVTK